MPATAVVTILLAPLWLLYETDCLSIRLLVGPEVMADINMLWVINMMVVMAFAFHMAGWLIKEVKKNDEQLGNRSR